MVPEDAYEAAEVSLGGDYALRGLPPPTCAMVVFASPRGLWRNLKDYPNLHRMIELRSKSEMDRVVLQVV